MKMNEDEREEASAGLSSLPLALAPVELVQTPASDGERTALPIRASGLVPLLPSKDRSTRRLAGRLFETCSWLAASDAYAVVRYAHLHRMCSRLAERLHAKGYWNKDGSVRKALGELVKLAAEMRSLESTLGLSPEARASLGVSAAVIGSLISVGAGGAQPVPLQELVDDDLSVYIQELRALAEADLATGNVTPIVEEQE